MKMIRPWIYILFLALVVISSVSAADLERGRLARPNAPFPDFFKALSARLRPRDKYLEAYVGTRQYELGKRQNNSDQSVTASPTSEPENPNSTPPDSRGSDTSADKSAESDSSTTASPQTPTPTPTPTESETPTETPPPETKSTPPPQDTTATTSPPPKTETQTPPEPTTKSSSSRESTSKPKPPQTTPPLEPTTPPARSSTQLITTTNSDGSLSTITSVVIVQPSATNSPGGNQPNAPGLQTNAAPTVAAGMEIGLLAVLGLSAVIAVAMAL